MTFTPSFAWAFRLKSLATRRGLRKSLYVLQFGGVSVEGGDSSKTLRLPFLQVSAVQAHAWTLVQRQSHNSPCQVCSESRTYPNSHVGFHDLRPRFAWGVFQVGSSTNLERPARVALALNRTTFFVRLCDLSSLTNPAARRL